MHSCLTTGGQSAPLLPRMLELIRSAREIEFGVAFIKSSGLELIFEALRDAVIVRDARLTILTSDYLDVTDPQALRTLLLLAERGADVRIFQAAGSQSFHLKAYIFVTGGEDGQRGSAFIGSSNISRPALLDGIEWNYEVRFDDQRDGHDISCFKRIREEYRSLLAHPAVTALDYPWINTYEARRRVERFPTEPGSNDPEPLPPTPNLVQNDALTALKETRCQGFQRGLVVMGTGLGKTYLAAFDAASLGAQRVLFVAHRDEILLQAEHSFLRIHPRASVGRYDGRDKDPGADLLFASVQTLGQHEHLQRFAGDHFDYVVVDEFHHAAATTYRKLLAHFQPKFLLGLTATPERTDQSDILSLCDGNLVFSRDLHFGIEQGLLCPFTYYGIYDEAVDYEAIPWRNSRFDPNALEAKLATLARAQHALREWRGKAQNRTLAFCVSIKHAKFMADRFQRDGISAAAVYADSDLDRGEALEQLADGTLEIIFSVDLFNEGMDLPQIDTVMMLRPTESKVLFLQQLGRGLRTGDSKERLVVLDFIGNHRGFFNKPQALFKVLGTGSAMAEFARKLRQGRLALPPGCFVNYDLEIIDFLERLDTDGPSRAYQLLRDSLGRRPTLSEYYLSGASVQAMRKNLGGWWQLVDQEEDLLPDEQFCLGAYHDFLLEVETTAMTKSFKAVLLESLLETNGLLQPPTLSELAKHALEVFRRRRSLISDIQPAVSDVDEIDEFQWLSYWRGNPINAWTGGNKKGGGSLWFEVVGDRFRSTLDIQQSHIDALHLMLQEIVDFRLMRYEERLSTRTTVISSPENNLATFPVPHHADMVELPFFPDLRIACGHFREGRHDVDEVRQLGTGYGRLDPSRHFIARAIGDSMDGGKTPVRDGDYLLLELMGSESAGSITGTTMVIERQGAAGEDQYLLRVVTKVSDGRYVLKANNPSYPDYEADDSFRTLARLRGVLDPLALSIGIDFPREQIPELFGEEFNVGNWNSGHVVLKDGHVHVLLVTLNKQGKAEEHRYHDYFMDERHFHWQSQNSTTPSSKRGRALIEHDVKGVAVHLFAREHKLVAGKAAPFRYYGPVRYLSHTGSGPMSIEWELSS